MNQHASQPHDERAHARFSPSSAYRWAGYLGEPGCPGSVNLSAQMPGRPAGPAALEGTKAHELLEACLKTWTAPRDQWYASGYDHEMLDHVTTAWQWFRNKRIEFPKAIFEFEQRVHITPEFHGTFDGCIYDPESEQLWIVDFKYGRQPHFAKGHPQSMSYALGWFMQNSPLAEHGDFQLGDTWLVIIQPRRYDDSPAVDEALVPGIQLIAWEAQTTKAMQEAGAEPPVYRPSKERCRYCPGAAICPALAPLLPVDAGGTAELPVKLIKPEKKRGSPKKGASTADRDPFPYLVTAKPSPIDGSIAVLRPSDLDPSALKQIAAALTGLPVVEAYCKAVKDLTQWLAFECDVEIPGFKIVNPDPRLAWNGEEKDIASALWKLAGLSPAITMPPHLISITDAKKLLAETFAVKGLDKETKAGIMDGFASLTGRLPSGKQVLVPISDKRPQAERDPSAIFEEVDFS